MKKKVSYLFGTIISLIASIFPSTASAYGVDVSYVPPKAFKDEKSYSDGKDYADSKAYTDTKGYADPKAYTDTKGYADPKSYTDTKGYADPKAYTDTKGYADPKAYTDTKGYADPKAYTDTKGYADPKAYTDTKGYADPKAYTDTKGYADSKTYTDSKTYLDTKPNGKSSVVVTSSSKKAYAGSKVLLDGMAVPAASTKEAKSEKQQFIKAVKEMGCFMVKNPDFKKSEEKFKITLNKYGIKTDDASMAVLEAKYGNDVSFIAELAKAATCGGASSK